ncbi:MAG: triosephosphate isomerase (TIM) [Halothiobacillaceae bacterium]|nr:MAG: triosephosphate isomerase (TIM) [Halothiobacillaceae bacterium]
MRQALVAGNWKMNGTRESARRLASEIVVAAGQWSGVEVAICPPYLLLDTVKSVLQGSPIRLGAQDLSAHAAGAYTGEISAEMLLEVGCQFVIVGHSERRGYHAESDALVAQKGITAVQAGLTPIVCVGETLAQREAGETEAVVGRQLDALLTTSSGLLALHSAVIAYEPVWAIGTGKTATPEQAQEVHAFIRGRVAKYDLKLAAKIRVLYGGSVKASANLPCSVLGSYAPAVVAPYKLII